MRKVATLLFLFIILFSLQVFADEVVVLKGGKIISVSEEKITEGSILCVNGKIKEIGDINIPADAKVIDISGKYIMPGIIDAHSHIALGGDTNEATSPVTPQIEMTDAFIPDDYSIYQALAGGVTSTKLMHGSANVIGGVNFTIKLKWGTSLKEMLIPGVRQQIKMALGENPKRLYGGKGREPQTRPGIFALLRQSLLDAQAYKAKWDEYNKKIAAGEEATPPGRDLKKDNLVKVLNGELAIDIHCYVANEVVVFLDIAKEFDLPVVALSHCMEGYKVRDAIAESGVSVLGHTDWWGYKMEAYDAIPYNLGMLHRSGINTAIISDSGDVMRRLNREAAKVVKYSGLKDYEALAMITINAAKALEIDKLTGSIEVGKDADFAIFDAHPLDSTAKCQMTIIEGKVWFDINNIKSAALN